jgi:hypothetical protein
MPGCVQPKWMITEFLNIRVRAYAAGEQHDDN